MSKFERLWAAHERKLKTSARNLTKDREDAADLLACTQARCWRGFSAYRNERPFMHWALTIMRRLWLDEVKKRNRRVRTVSYDAPMPDTDNAVLTDAVTDGEKCALEEIISRDSVSEITDALWTVKQKIVAGLIADGLSNKDISETTGWPTSTISNVFRTYRLREGHRA